MKTVTYNPISRHQYSDVIVGLSTTLYSIAGCGFRSIIKILETFEETFDGLIGKIPCHNTIENWVKKCGLKEYNDGCKSFKNTDYAEIIDESFCIGQENLLLTLGIPASHQGRPLNSSDVRVLDLSVEKNWNGEKVCNRLLRVSEKVGHNPSYIISDNANVMVKGIKDKKLIHYRDVSHSLALCAERVYKKDDEFIKYNSLMTKSQAELNSTKYGYLIPPKQRSKARFMNLSEWVNWSARMIKAYKKLSSDEKKEYAYVYQNKAFINEMSQIVLCVNSIEKLFKNEGFSTETAKKAKELVDENFTIDNIRIERFKTEVINYISKDKVLLKKEDIHNNSSDIIESIFGKYKYEKSANKLNGVTSFVLFLPLYTRLRDKQKAMKFDFKKALEEIKMEHIETWSKENLSQNFAQIRTQVLKKAS